MSRLEKIPATIVTGFLGAGKTSLVRHLIGAAAGHRLAIIVNEFGELGIDRDLLLGCGDETCTDDDIVELAEAYASFVLWRSKSLSRGFAKTSANLVS